MRDTKMYSASKVIGRAVLLLAVAAAIYLSLSGYAGHIHIWTARTVHHDTIGHVERSDEGTNIWVTDAPEWDETVTACALCGAAR